MGSALFSPLALRGLTLANRIVVSPMCQYSGRDGVANDWHLVHLGQYLVSGVGLVISEATAVEPRGRITPGCLGLWSDDSERALGRIVDFWRAHGNARFGIQLAHAGRKASAREPWRGGTPLPPGEGGWTPVGPSALAFDDGWPVPHALDRTELATVRDAFVGAARRAARLGFDLLELHAAHGYLLHSFLSPLSNRRDDDYGGPLERRMRFPLEVFEAVRAAWPAERPLGVRVSTVDYAEGGQTVDDTVAFATRLRAAGCDFIDASGGALVPHQKIPLGPGYQVPFAAAIRARAGIPTMAVGLITEPRQAEAIVAEGHADMVAMGRRMLYDPRWTWHAARDLGADAAYPPQYLRARPAV